MNLIVKKSSQYFEREWLDKFGPKFGDDQQAMLYAQLGDILKGSLAMAINNDHIAAYQVEAKPLHEFLDGA